MASEDGQGPVETIGVIGIGWVGLVTSACFAELGHDVVAMDVDAGKVERLSAGDVPIHEPRLGDLVRSNAERITFTTDMSELLGRARLLFCCVDTPPTYSGDADLSRVRAVVAAITDPENHALVMKSTVPAGTGDTIKRDVPGMAYVSCPEFLREGSAVEDFLNPDRVVIGADEGDEWAADVVADVYRPLGGELVVTDVASAEMIKLASNAFLATKISFANEIANVCDEVGADVSEVARGMGLDNRIGPAFLKAGIGYGGSCFAGGETVLMRQHGSSPRLTRFDDLWDRIAAESEAVDGEAVEPESLEVLSWVPGEAEPEWMPVSVLTRRDYDGEMVEVATKTGRRITTTADHPFIVGDGRQDDVVARVLASDLTTEHWLPLARGSQASEHAEVASLAGVLASGEGEIEPGEVITRPRGDSLARLAGLTSEHRAQIFEDHPRPSARYADVRRTGALRLSEAGRAELDLDAATFGTARNGTYIPGDLRTDEAFWRVVGLYIAEGCVSRDGARSRISWHFHPEREEHLVSEVADYWRSQGVKATVATTPTSRKVSISSRLLADWWLNWLGLGRTSYEQRIPDRAWDLSRERKQALLSGIWEGDGSWSLIGSGPSVILEWGTISEELAEGVARLLTDLGIVASWRRGRTKKSTAETHWLRVSGADQVERAEYLVPAHQRDQVRDLIARQTKRIAPAGHRSFGSGTAWVRIASLERRHASEPVYSLKVPGSQTIVTTGGLIASQCFPKDVSALKMLAGNTGYHFQLLNAVIEVNELQKRRVIAKLSKHLGSLVGKRIALLGLAFKPETDDMREASSLVLAARLQGEGASVSAFDPVASDAAAPLLPGIAMASSAEEAISGADGVVLVTEWKQFSDLDWPALASSMTTPVLVDGRNFLDPGAVRAAGFAYEGIGRPKQSGAAAA